MPDTSATPLQEILRGLAAAPKRIPSKYFYDDRGARLFAEICDLEEYYPTRTEVAILRAHAAEIAGRLGPSVLLFELGSGSSSKTRLLLEHLARPAAYVPIDISAAGLRESTASLAAEYPDLRVLPLVADFTDPITLPRCDPPERRRIGFFSGSTIGNFEEDDAVRLLQRIAALCGTGGALVIGVDLKKEREVLERAYDDARGVTAAFNRNILRHVNHVAGADFDPAAFAHLALWNDAAGRIEMYLVSRHRQVVQVTGHAFALAAGERILTEYSHKYDVGQFAGLAGSAGFVAEEVWVDPQSLFSVHYLAVP